MELANPTNEDIYLSNSRILAKVYAVVEKDVFCFDLYKSFDTSTSNVSNKDIDSKTDDYVPDFTEELKSVKK
jgi:hypothetical protein